MSNYSYGQLEQLWTQAGGSVAQAPLAAAVALAESRGSSTATNPSSATGLWQVETSAHPQYTAQQLLNPLENAKAAVAISNDGTNWNQWATFTSGAYKNFLPSAGGNPFPFAGPTITGTAGKVARGIGIGGTILTAPLIGAGELPALAEGEGAAGAGAAEGAAAGGAGAGTLAGILGAATATAAIAALIQWFVTNWLRIVEFLGGVVMVGYGLVLLGKVGMAEG